MTPMRGSDDAVRRFYDYLVERERVRLRKEAGLPWPWTDDEIISQFKFTNVRRDDDRTTRHLVEHFYSRRRTASPTTCLMNCAIYRYHGTLEFADAVGWSTMFPQALDRVRRTARGRLLAGERVFTGAYMITNMKVKGPKEDVVNGFLNSLWRRSTDLANIARTTLSWAAVSEEMRKIKGFGGSGFMVKEILLDTMHTNFWPNGCGDRDTWTPIGPGANRGLERIFGYIDEQTKPIGRLNEKLAFELLSEVWAAQRKFWPDRIDFGHDHGPIVEAPLSMHDVQFGLCEFDKYERTRLGQGRPRSRYRVKK